MPDLAVVCFHLEDCVPLLEVLDRSLPRRLGLRPHLTDPRGDLEACFHAPRKQYDASALLRTLEAAFEGERVLLLTDADLFIGIFTFVLGAGLLGEPAAVVSTRRLRPETFGLPPDPALFEERVVKETVHELGHTYGLRHCHDLGCVMSPASIADEVDAKGPDFLGNCAHLLAEGRSRL